MEFLFSWSVLLLSLFYSPLSSAFIIPALTPPCPSGHFKCKFGNRCIPQEEICNGIEDCPRGSDEVDCELENATTRTMEPFKASKHIVITMKICPRGYYGEGCRLTRTTASTASTAPSTAIFFAPTLVSSYRVNSPSFSAKKTTFSFTWIVYAVVSVALGITISGVTKCSCCRRLATKFRSSNDKHNLQEVENNIMCFENPVYSLPCAPDVVEINDADL